MKSKNEFARRIKPFEQHGVLFTSESDTQTIGNCPFCGKEGKFYCNHFNLLWDCKYCGRNGNIQQFLEHRSGQYQEAFRKQPMMTLYQDRSIRPKTLKSWGVGWSGSFYTIPMDGNPNREIVNLKRYTIKGRSMATAGCKLALVFPKQFNNTETLWLCEGEWDGMALYELLRNVGCDDDVCAVPGASAMPGELLPMFTGKTVICIYDNDGPGQKGALATFKRLTGIAKEMKFVHWPIGLPDGFDFRDYYRVERNMEACYTNLVGMLKPLPPGIEETKAMEEVSTAPVVYSGTGTTQDDVSSTFTKWLKMDDVDCLSILFGSVLANRLDGDPLWMFLVAPPGGMKSELLMSLDGCPGIITATTITPSSLISGYSGIADPSLIPRLDGKVLVVKDFTTILSMNADARESVFGILRDAYDGKVEAVYGNAVLRKYESSFGIIAGVTSAIEKHSAQNSMLGERFIRYRLAQSGKVTAGKEVILRALRNLKRNTKMRDEIREAAVRVVDWDISEIPYPEESEGLLERITGLAQWIGTLRGVVARDKYTREVQHKPMVEIGTRLGKQLLKLAYGIALYQREEVISDDTYRLITEVAQSTAPDYVEEVVKQLYIHMDGVGDCFDMNDVMEWCNIPHPSTVKHLLEDLTMLKIAVRKHKRWGLSRGVYRVMKGLRLYDRQTRWRKLSNR